MDRRVVIVTLLVVLTLLTLALAGIASGSTGAPAGPPTPSLSGEFAHTQLACLTVPAGPSVHLPADGWCRVHGPRRLHDGGHRPATWV
jgi:hypothetical protein